VSLHDKAKAETRPKQIGDVIEHVTHYFVIKDAWAHVSIYNLKGDVCAHASLELRVEKK
jgi:hypothetical protein